MVNYKGSSCCVCNKPFTSGNDIVVCPECGAPYHRECYQEVGHCVFEAQHGTGFEYTPPATAGSGNRCGNCGADNPQGNLFCENCGASLTKKEEDDKVNNVDENGMRRAQPQQTPVGNSNMNFTSANTMEEPFQQIFQTAVNGREYDGISSNDWIKFIGKSAPYYLFQFLRMDESKRKTSVCWSALFFAPFYFAYRKMWNWAILSSIATLIVNIPSFIQIAQILGINLGFTLSTQTLNTLSIVCMGLSWAMSIFFGVFAFYLFRQHGAKKIAAIKNKAIDSSVYQDTLTRAGGTSIIGVVVLVGIIMAASYAFAFWIGPDRVLALYNMYY